MTSGRTVLVVTARDDHTSDLIVQRLRDHHPDVGVVRIDPADDTYPLEMAVELHGDRWEGTISQGPVRLDLSRVGAVLWRWAWDPQGHPGIGDELARAWAAQEDAAALLGTLKALPAFWVNHPDAAASAVPKPVQLRVAVACGFAVPRTLVTTSGSAVAGWARRHSIEEQTLNKAWHCQGLRDGGMVPAERIEVAGLPGELLVASMFQHLIQGAHVRLTAVRDQLFACEIRGTTRTDWRPEQQQAEFLPLEVPVSVRAHVRSFMMRFGLNYGAFDFVAAEGGTWWFLECNPTGQYGFVELKTGQPITAALAAVLASEAVKDRPEARPEAALAMAG
ncbi:MvdC/MvdD family ATP grasp protein [Actinomadura rupiterrae]|uniref:MvdC/MvdD family ATP grasp protein n=1 Tax=Actinomadura rupiterrae TaxID=559627 RepID=UPI0020A5831F|nr:hypothetical protein [Actinomadura rupiterrae]MCP2339150.1 hypothetical protein [Actinomadura rupiterrae]